MTKKISIVFLFLLFSTFGYSAARSLAFPDLRGSAAAGNAPSKRLEQIPKRIVSLAPSITEILFLLNLTDRVVGVTQYCIYLPEATSKTIIGGYSNPNYESIYALRPDLVVLLTEHKEEKRQIEKLGLTCLTLDHQTIPAIMTSIKTLGRVCGKETAAVQIVRDLTKRMSRIENRTAGKGRPRTLVCIGGYMQSDGIESVTIAGGNTFYDNLIRCAGGVNAYQGAGAYPIISREGLIRLNPEVILIMESEMAKKDIDRTAIKKEWTDIPQLEAVRSGQIHVFGQSYVVIPGPRFILILEEMAAVIHPGME
ncbi:MAG: ABC transporter substrate-binding protein [Deltaproteobacteria bacterium]|nr:ABC transporter substrate-binding protein [Deltaproteobacteria bacterium]